MGQVMALMRRVREMDTRNKVVMILRSRLKEECVENKMNTR